MTISCLWNPQWTQHNGDEALVLSSYGKLVVPSLPTLQHNWLKQKWLQPSVGNLTF